MKKLLIVLGILAALMIGGYVLLASLLSPARIKTTVLPAVSEAIGRDVRVEGDISISLFPTFGLELEQLVVANPANMSLNSNLLEVEKTTLAVAIMPLLKKELEIREFIMTNPKLSLVGLANGSNNWTFTNTETATAAPATTEAAAPSTMPLSDIRIGTIAVRNGVVQYQDRVSGGKFNVTDTNFELNMPTLEAAAVLEGSALFNSQRLKGRLKLDTPAELLNAKPATLSLDTTTPFAEVIAEAKLTYTQTPRPVLDAKLTQLSIAREGLNTSGQGQIKLVQGSTKPEITANLDFAYVELMSPAPAGTEKQATATPAEPLKWSAEPIDFSGLGSANVEANLTIDQIKTSLGSIGPVSAGLSLINSRLALNLKRFDMFDGKLTSEVVLNARSAPASATIKADLADLQIARAMPKQAEPYGISGFLSSKLDLQTRGNSIKAFMDNMNGTTDIGAVRVGAANFDLKKTAEQHLGGLGPIVQKNVSDETVAAIKQNLTDMAASVFFDQGQGQAVVKLAGPVLGRGGEGRVNLPAADMSIHMTPLVKTSQTRDIILPFYVEGPLNAPAFSPDQEAIAQEVARQAARIGAEKLIKKALKKGDDKLGAFGAILEAATNRRDEKGETQGADNGQDNENNAQPEGTTPKNDPAKELQKALGNLFGK